MQQGGVSKATKTLNLSEDGLTDYCQCLLLAVLVCSAATETVHEIKCAFRFLHADCI